MARRNTAVDVLHEVRRVLRILRRVERALRTSQHALNRATRATAQLREDSRTASQLAAEDLGDQA